MTKHKLFALALSEANIKKANAVRFSRITPGYILLYLEDDTEKPDGAAEVAGRDLRRLTGKDRDWLLDCNVLLLTEAAAQKAPEIAQNLSLRVEELEKALEEEAGKLGEGTAHGGNRTL